MMEWLSSGNKKRPHGKNNDKQQKLKAYDPGNTTIQTKTLKIFMRSEDPLHAQPFRRCYIPCVSPLTLMQIEEKRCTHNQ